MKSIENSSVLNTWVLLVISSARMNIDLSSRDGRAFYSHDFLHFFHCYISMLKYFYNLSVSIIVDDTNNNV